MNKEKHNICILPVLFFYMSLPNILLARHSSREQGVLIRSFTFAGSGCPAGSLTAALSEDRTDIFLQFNSFSAVSDFDTVFSESRKNCQILLDLEIPDGISIAVTDLKLQGFVSLEEGASAVVKSQIYFQGAHNNAQFSHRFLGSVEGSYEIEEVIASSERVFSSCHKKRALNINTQLRTSSPDGQLAFLSMSEMKGRVITTLHLDYRSCED